MRCARGADLAFYLRVFSVGTSALRPITGPKKLGWLAGGGCGWGRGPLAVVGVEVPAVGAVGEAVRGSQADPVVWLAGQGRLW